MTGKDEEDKELFLAKSLRFMQESLQRSGPSALAGYTMMAAIFFLGGIGYLLDRWWNTSPWLLVIGLFAGIAVGFFELARIIWRK